ncbi:hypothetical protein BXZ70DRAFT_950158 [Cristinia sonorae]|uniref:YMC020W-like alpha/beta hydrolase domain-containing protein n=1 Tax=Cristinia sonorae TaxID=1940300 RepID=A0A8K0XMU7_9AGAR|nr:hypothetical protein BXZ70DRAFT_950158 [Cristinia sonorae]
MSSPHRSNHRPPTWSRRSSHKPRASTGISVIFAQPLQGSPLRSAIDNLPAIGIDDSASFISEMSRKREQRDEDLDEDSRGYVTQKELDDARSVTSASGSYHGVEQVPQDATPQVIDLTDEAPNPDTAVGPLTESPKTASEPLLPEAPLPTVSLPPPSDSHDASSQSRRSSWFSFSRSREKIAVSSSVPEPNMMSQLSRADIQPSSVSVNEVAAAHDTSDALPLPTLSVSQPETMTSPQPVPNSLHVEQRPTSPPALTTSNTASTISSVDDEVPPPKAVVANSMLPESTSAIVQSRDLNGTGRKPSISSLNPSSSRFMLRIPLLGRPKVPLDQAVAASNSEDTNGSSSPGPVEELSPASGIEAGPTEEQVPPAIIETAPPSTSESDAAQSPPADEQSAPAAIQEVTVTSTTSWWSYIGLGENAATTSNPDVAPEKVDEVTVTAVSQDTPASPEALHPTEDEGKAESSPEPAGEVVQVPPPGAKPQSLLSSETDASQGSAWYTPWNWYTSSTSESASGSRMPQDDKSTDQASPEEVGKSESEMVKEEALARDEAIQTIEALPVPQSSLVSDAPSSPSPSSNPIESSISTHRSGWASFFMSRTLLVKSITDGDVKRDENGMEVMDIEEEEAPEPEPVDTAGLPSSPRSDISTSGQSQAQPPVPPTPPKQREPRKQGPAAPPLTNSESIKKETTKGTAARSSSPAPSKKSGSSTPTQPKPSPPNLVLPTWADTFHTLPRSAVPPPPPPPKSALSKTLSVVSGALFARDGAKQGSVKGKERQFEHDYTQYGMELPKAYDVLGQTLDPDLLAGNCRVVVIGVAGWSPGAVTRTIAGGLPSSSSKFVNMTCSALEKFEEDHGVKFQKVTKMPLEGDGTISRKVAKVHAHLLENKEWLEDLHAADVIFVATHSQGSIVSTHLLDRLIREGHILTPRNVDILNNTAAAIAPGGSISASASRTQKICCLALCGIHLGPLRYLKTSSLLQPYIQYFENAAARELFDFQDTETETSKEYVKALRTVMDHGAKMVYIASLNDQVVPVYSGLFTAASHPRILRALYIDADAYHSSDFLSNLLVLLIRIMNIGLSDSGLLAHLSEATAGTLSGIGHSTAYEELATYSLAVNYLFLVNDGPDVRKDLVIEPFNAVNEQNDYEIPWSLRDLIADERVAHFFASEFAQLRDAFEHWQPRTSILRDIKRKLQPIQRLSSIRGSHSRL